MPERPWKELVAEGRRLVAQEGDRKWQWGDLALEVEPVGDVRGGSHGRLDRLHKWAEEIGFFETGLPFDSLRQYRHVAHHWPSDKRRSDVSWSVHRALSAMEDRFTVVQSRPKWTMDEAKTVAGRTFTRPVAPVEESREEQIERVRELVSDPEVARAVMKDAQVRHVVDEARPAEDRADQARRLIRDPAVARHVVQDNTARSAMAKAAKEMEDAAEERQRKRAPGLVGMSDFYAATGELSRMRQAGMKSLDAMRKLDLSEDQRESLKDDHSRVRLVSEWIDSYLDSGDHSFDKELDALLREET